MCKYKREKSRKLKPSFNQAMRSFLRLSFKKDSKEWLDSRGVQSKGRNREKNIEKEKIQGNVCFIIEFRTTKQFY